MYHDLLDAAVCLCMPGFTCSLIRLRTFASPNCLLHNHDNQHMHICCRFTCANGGMCHDLVDSAVCLCMPGFTGSTCSETEDICITSPCENNGNCVAINNQRRRCECLDGFFGRNCEIDYGEGYQQLTTF